MSVWNIARGHPGFTNVVIKRPRISIDEVVYRNELMKNGGKCSLQHKEKSVALKKALVQNFPKHCGLALVAFMEVINTARVFVLPDKALKFCKI